MNLVVIFGDGSPLKPIAGWHTNHPIETHYTPIWDWFWLPENVFFFCLRIWFWWCCSCVFVVDLRSHSHLSCWPTSIRIRCIKICVENWSICALKANAFADAIYSFHQIEFEWSKMGIAVAISEWEERNKKKERVRVEKKIAIEHQVKTRIFACWDLLRLWLDDISHPLDTVWLFEFVTNPNDGILICFAFNARKHKMYVFGKYPKTPVAPLALNFRFDVPFLFFNAFRAQKHAFIF